MAESPSAVSGETAAFLRDGARALNEGDAAAAARLFREAVASAPQLAAAHHALGLALRRAGRHGDAVDALRKAVRLAPGDAEVHNTLGLALAGRGDHAQAAAAFARADSLRPDTPRILVNLGKVRRALGDAAAALAALEHACSLAPDDRQAQLERGNALRDLDRPEEAAAAYRLALEIDPADARARNNLGLALQETGRVDAALSALRDAAAAVPDDAEIRKNLGMAQLLAGELGSGFDDYEARWSTADARPRPFPQARWDGSGAVESVALWGEQGVGDEILFASMIPDAVATGVRAVVECDPRLVPLFRRSFPGTEVVARSDPPHGTALACDRQAPTGGLGRLFRRQAADFPGRLGYLLADADAATEMRRRYGMLGGARRIGIAWRSGNARWGAKRSFAPVGWAPVLRHPGTVFFNLQYGDCSAEIAALRDRLGVTVHADPTVDPLADLDRFAAQVSAMDLVISIDNATVHMAGALGVPVWTLLPFAPDWRWGAEGDRTPWYPGMRLFRQPRAGDWGSVVDAVAAALDGPEGS